MSDNYELSEAELAVTDAIRKAARMVAEAGGDMVLVVAIDRNGDYSYSCDGRTPKDKARICRSADAASWSVIEDVLGWRF